jgi:hypothetical protein
MSPVCQQSCVAQPVHDEPAFVLPQERSWGDKEEQMVVAHTGCDNPALVRKVLSEVGGSVEQAVERVIALMAEDDAGMEGQEGQEEQEGQQGQEDGQQGQQQEEQQGQQDAVQAAAAAGAGSAAAGGTDISGAADEPDEGPGGAFVSASQAACSGGGTDAGAAAGAGKKVHHVKAGKSVKVKSKAGADAAPSRNKPCPCGSSQKYKNCCGAAAAATARRKQAAGEVGASAEVAAQQLQTLFI